MMDEIVTYAGVPITEMSREELIEVVQEMARAERAYRESYRHSLDTWAMIAKARSCRPRGLFG